MEEENKGTKTLRTQLFKSCPWNRNIDIYLIKKSEYAKHKAEVSKYYSHYYEKLKYIFSASSLILTILLSPISIALQNNWSYLTSILILISACLNGIGAIFKFEYKHTQFVTVHKKYTELSNFIDCQLILEAKYRMEVNMLLMEINFMTKEISDIAEDILEPNLNIDIQRCKVKKKNILPDPGFEDIKIEDNDF
jgi:hypothetical protein